MSSFNTPFIFGAAGASQGQTAPAPSVPSQHQHSSITPNPMPSTPQTAFQQNAQLPGIDMSALAGISPDQVALIARLLQSGALLPPPPPPGASAATTPAHVATAPANPLPQQPANAQQEHDIDMDKEEGEVEDVEANSTPISRAPDVLPMPARNGTLNATTHRSARQDTLSTARARVNSPRNLSNDHHIPAQTLAAAANGIYIPKEKQSQDFVLAMHQAGYTYQQLAKMVDDPKPLRRMFRLLGLPVSSDYGLTNGKQPDRESPHARSSNSAANGSVPGLAHKPTPKTPAPLKPAGKADRNEYLKKLQALKAGKAGPSSTQSTPREPALTSPAGAVLPTATQQTAEPSAPPATTSTPLSKAVKTELARQRLEAFKAERAAKQQGRATADGVSPLSSSPAVAAAAPTISAGPQDVPSSGSLGAGLDAIAAKVIHQPQLVTDPETTVPQIPNQPLSSPTPPTPSGSFSGLPGLFMQSAPQQASSPTAKQSTQTIPTKRSITTDSPSAQIQAKRPFGQSRSASEDESFIIENSDDEDDGTHMNIDAASASINARFASLRNAPLHQNKSSISGLQQGSAPSTPGANTPGGVTYEQKLKAIEELNRRIAVREAKNRALGEVPLTRSEATAAAAGLPGITTLPDGTSPDLGPEQQLAQDSTNAANLERPASAAALKLKQQKEELRQRIAELEKARKYPVFKDFPPRSIESSPPRNQAIPVMPAESEPSQAVTQEFRGSFPAVATLPTSTANVETAASDDGEVDDESDFDFYGDEDAAIAAKPMVDTRHVDSQATTVSRVTEANAPEAEASGVPSPNAALLGMSASEDGEVGSSDGEADEDMHDATGRAPDVAAVEVAPAEDHQLAQEASEPMGEELAGSSAQAQPTPPGSDVEMDDEESDSGDSDLNEISDLNEPFELVSAEQSNASTGRSHISFEPVVVDDTVNEQAAIDDIESSDASSTRSSGSDEYEPEPAEMQMDDSAILQADRAADDDLAPELQPNEDQQAAIEPSDQLHEKQAKTFYTPYESVMTRFKDYRYHPQYLAAIPSGFKSRTFNHCIDPDKQLCPTEAQGETCQDSGCQGQHFDKMVISDNMLLQQMGMKNIPARTKEEGLKWSKGLTDLIQTLKASNVRDAPTIAAAIAQYRREFIGDPTRIISMR